MKCSHTLSLARHYSQTSINTTNIFNPIQLELQIEKLVRNPNFRTIFRTSALCVSHCSKSSFFVQKFNFDFARKLSNFFGVKNSWKCCGFRLFSCWQLWFHEKNCKKKFGWKCWSFVKIEFLDKNLTFRIVIFYNN